ncbi:NADH-quinone oxidoreductase subunit 5 family protein [Terracoccus luteus]|uniref:NADH-quinone oxidoreductase subunit L n=1 Tax=Terracoccus luteus TaxID=53356 RepID=A0A839PTJ6_9MICO|nr:NADH-quinone oxidoreductase subunit L [Terracoccus luteus]MBB2986084.1 NADH-quinone oxidoreductase subunit L [Terracoccus luteus]MCP2171736.1 NADH-quinone oxidoreductase subunit L [Terracoccus luteus]
MTWVVRLLVLLPALAGLAGLLAGRSHTAARALAVGTASAVVLLAIVQWVSPVGTADLDSTGALPAGELSLPLHLLSDDLAALVSLVVAVVVLAIQVFTVWYLRDDPRYARFAATVSLFAAGMLLVVQSADLVLVLVGWEVMGWCSWLLIGHDSERPAARRAAYKAFVVTRVADIGMVVGLVALAVRAGSTDLTTVLAATTPDAALTVGLVGVVVGVAGKSGLVPFHDWLPDAMEGPTPASALIHAATMVAAGSYLVARLLPLLAVDDAARTVLALLAAVTMVWAALLACAQADLKRLLAYSTLSQVAIMLGALATTPAAIGPVAGVSHLVGHAFFKALLFLGAGWLAALLGATALTALRGGLRGRGALRWAMAIGLASLAGVPPLVGFLTKDTAVDAALEGALDGVTGAGGAAAWLVVVALLVTVALTAFYCTRAWLLLDTPAAEQESPAADDLPPQPLAVGEPGALAAHGEHRPITLPTALAVCVLAVLTVLGSLLLPRVDGIHLGVVSTLLSLALVALGGWAAFTAARRGQRDAAEVLPTSTRERAVSGFGADAGYAAVGRAVTAVARVVVTLDRDVVDAYPRAAAVAVRQAGRLAERGHRAVPGRALLGVVVGIVAVALLGVTAWR